MRQSISFLFVVAITLCLAVANAGETKTPHAATHKQSRVIKAVHDGKPIALNTFCLDSDANILACVGGDNVQYTAGTNGQFETKTVKAPKLLQRYSPDGKLLLEVKLDFKPTAINQASDGTIFVAGVGRVAQISKQGEILVVADSPHIGSIEELKKKAKESAAEQMKQLTGSLSGQVERIEKRIKDLKEASGEELSERDKLRLKTLEKQKELYCDQEKQMTEAYSSMFSTDAVVERALGITSLAVTSRDVFLCCGSTAGHGYEVWRMDRDLSSPKKVVSGLGGCCGQCDIQATDEHLILAENTSFRVGLLDRDGKRLTSFGKQDRTSAEGFASCCNPMNVRCCSNGDILTAESSIGYIKRFSKDGELIGTVGKAKIGGGCKHVALGYDEKRDHYYMQYQDRNQICVLVPLSEAPEFTEDELLAKAAMEGLGQKLIGDGLTTSGGWSLTGKRPTAKKATSGFFGLFSSALSAASGSEDTAADSEPEEVSVGGMETATYFEFHPDGKLDVRGGYFEDGHNGWTAVSQDKKKNTLRFSQLQDGIQYYDFNVEFIDDNKAKFSMLYGDSVMSSRTYHRVPIGSRKEIQEPSNRGTEDRSKQATIEPDSADVTELESTPQSKEE